MNEITLKKHIPKMPIFFKPNTWMDRVDIADLTDEEALEFTELMKTEFLAHRQKRRDKRVLLDLEVDEQNRIDSLKKAIIYSSVCEIFEIKTEDLFTTNRARIYAYPRFVCWYMMRYNLTQGKTNTNLYPFKSIGKTFSRDHGSIVSGIYVVEGCLDAIEDGRGQEADRKIQKACNLAHIDLMGLENANTEFQTALS